MAIRESSITRYPQNPWRLTYRTYKAIKREGALRTLIRLIFWASKQRSRQSNNVVYILPKT